MNKTPNYYHDFPEDLKLQKVFFYYYYWKSKIQSFLITASILANLT